jgi:hypothetical protein
MCMLLTLVTKSGSSPENYLVNPVPEYGLVFGIFELTVFLVSPVIGANLNRMGMKVC